MKAEPKRKRYIDAPAHRVGSTRSLVLGGLRGAAALPWYLARGLAAGTPGLAFHWRAAAMAGAVLRGRGRVPLRSLAALLLHPVDTFRYFEFDFAWRALAHVAPLDRLLDLSSPRLLPLLVARAHPGIEVELVNPDAADLAQTRALALGADLGARCRFHAALAADLPFPDASFDAITSLSVIEHVRDDRQAVANLWRLVRPGGSLVLTVPCARAPVDEFISHDPFGVQGPSEGGYVFWQRLYDAAGLRERIFSVTDAPVRFEVFGETEPDHYTATERRKLWDPTYAYWQEPWIMGRDHRRFRTVDDLPGVGIAGLEFVKQ